MKASVEWIKELLPKLAASPEAIARRLTDSGLEVESLVFEADAYRQVVVAEVRELAPHPSADKLQVASVYDGERVRTVICGATNVAAGQKVALALPGTSLLDGKIIEARNIRGVASEGMICSEAELGLPSTSEGILVLPPRSKPGRSVADRIGKTGALMEIAAGPNRPDVLSHLGLARELAALFRLPMPAPRVRLKESGEPASLAAKVEIKAGARCARYLGRVIFGVKVGPSPKWVVRRLESVGLRSINNVVDATNLTLMEIGHPLHAFDLDRLSGGRVVVRMAKEKERFKGIDEVERELDPDDLVIADARSAVALAGVMGGLESGVSQGTANLLLESAWFDPRSVRRSGRRYGLHTEASHRFERGADPEALEAAIDRCAELVTELAGGRIASGRIEAVKREWKPKVVPIRPERATLLLGRTVDKKEIRTTLTALGLSKVARPKDRERVPAKERGPKRKGSPPAALFFEVPSWRVDLNIEADLIEEIARIAGYGSIPTIMPTPSSEVWTESKKRDPATEIRTLLCGLGFFEAVCLAFNSPQQLLAFGFDQRRAVKVQNPLGEESAFLRVSLLPALLKAARLNQGQLRQDLRLFELGKSFEWQEPPGELPIETEQLALLLSGNRLQRSWASSREMSDIFDLKAAIEALLGRFHIERVSYEEDRSSWLHPRTATRLMKESVFLGRFGELHPEVMRRFDLEGPPLFVAEIELARLLALAGKAPRFQALSKHPPVTRDLSFFIDTKVAAETILFTVRSVSAPHLEQVEIFDVYQGKGVPEGKRSVAIAMRFRALDRTLTDAEVEASQAKIITRLTSEIAAQIRSA